MRSNSGTDLERRRSALSGRIGLLGVGIYMGLLVALVLLAATGWTGQGEANTAAWMAFAMAAPGLVLGCALTMGAGAGGYAIGLLLDLFFVYCLGIALGSAGFAVHDRWLRRTQIDGGFLPLPVMTGRRRFRLLLFMVLVLVLAPPVFRGCRLLARFSN